MWLWPVGWMATACLLYTSTILSTLPSAGVGALLALMVSGHELDIIAIIGIVLLIGIVKKNAIMMIDFALDAERTEGLAPRDAIFQACLLRFRPILMTTFAAILGALPLMLGAGTGSELRNPLGVATVSYTHLLGAVRGDTSITSHCPQCCDVVGAFQSNRQTLQPSIASNASH